MPEADASEGCGLQNCNCIACEGLSDDASGQDAHSLDIANENLFLVLGWSDLDERKLKIRPNLSSSCWILTRLG
ncbi:hypothetical protein SLEP1_g7054 [Rubroshorea leprosula]|uniref:Uncharacterized protein n=1 Tax=Rubroshorea leprosula TaxID=152421 RepID=A0AAV5I7Y8_9ROSI|nr:hypothetical protein SLEP1_g7054 [Rubroshorea leprosula]